MVDTEPKQKELGAVDRNIAAVHRVRTTADESRPRGQRFVDSVAAFAGSTKSIYFHFALYGAWLALFVFSGESTRRSTGASMENISLAASLEAIFLAVFVLINQRRMDSVERKNSDLHIQMSLLAEHEVTRLAQVTDLIAERLGVSTSSVSDLDEVKKDIDPDEILERISKHENQKNSATQSNSTSKLETP